MFTPEPTVRDKVIEAVEDGLIDKDYLIQTMLNWLPVDEVRDMLHANEIATEIGVEDDDEAEEDD